MIDGSSSLLLPPARRACIGRADDRSNGGAGIPSAQTPRAPSRVGKSYLWAYTVVFLTATMLSVQRMPADTYLLVLATLGYGLALCGYAARRFRQEPIVRRIVGKQWVVTHIVGVYSVLRCPVDGLLRG